MENDYKGWSIYDKITLVIKQEKFRKTNYNQAYVVNTKDKKQLQTAINWGTITKYHKTENDKPNDYYKEEIKPLIVETDNTGFTICLLNSAEGSSQGGKVSFWNCLIEHEELDIHVVIGINSELLLNVLLQNDFSHGKCLNNFSFARCNGAVGLLSTNMVEYKEALKDMKTKSAKSKGKTTKWKIGHSYETLTMSNLYLGEIYRPFEVKVVTDYSYSSFKGDHRKIYLIKNIEQKRHASIDLRYKADDYLENLENIDKLLNYFKDKALEICKDSKNNNKLGFVTREFEGLVSDGKAYMFEKLPSRQEGKITMSIDESTYKDKIHNCLTEMKELVLNSYSEHKYLLDVDELSSFFVDTYKRDIESVTDTERELLKVILSEENLKRWYRENDTFSIYTVAGDTRVEGINLSMLLK